MIESRPGRGGGVRPHRAIVRSHGPSGAAHRPARPVHGFRIAARCGTRGDTPSPRWGENAGLPARRHALPWPRPGPPRRGPACLQALRNTLQLVRSVFQPIRRVPRFIRRLLRVVRRGLQRSRRGFRATRKTLRAARRAIQTIRSRAAVPASLASRGRGCHREPSGISGELPAVPMVTCSSTAQAFTFPPGLPAAGKAKPIAARLAAMALSRSTPCSVSAANSAVSAAILSSKGTPSSAASSAPT